MNQGNNNFEAKGTFVAILSFLAWGFLPLFWRMLEHVSSMEILANRIIWSLIFTSIIILGTSRWREFIAGMKSTREILLLACRAFFLGGNWFTYVWGINHGHVVDCSLGYFITPLAVVLLGVVFLRERLTKNQVIALAFTCLAEAILIIN